MPEIFVAKKGDTGIPITAILQDKNGRVSLAGWSVRFIMTLRDETTPKVDASATIHNDQIAHKGECSYTFQASDIDAVGTYNCEFVGTTPSGKQITFPRQRETTEQFGVIIIEQGLS